MNFAEYPALAARTEKPLATVFARLEHAALGIVTEVGEIATPIKRIAIYGKQLSDIEKNGKTILENLAEEIGDVLWYLAIIDNVGELRFFQSQGVHPERRLADMVQTAALRSISRRLAVLSAAVAVEVEDMFTGDGGAEDVIAAAGAAMLQELVNLAYVLGLDITQIAASNIAKLQARYPEAYSDVAAEARADKGGEDARNS